MSTPESVIKICSGVRLNNSYQHTIWFADRVAQDEYFASKVVKTFSDYTYLRKQWDILVESPAGECENWTYLFFTNGSKTYYYFINDIEYENDYTVNLHLELDVMQTYMWDYEVLPSFIDREHTASDLIGENIVPESLELGEYVSINTQDVDLNEWYIMVQATDDFVELLDRDSESKYSYGGLYNNTFSGIKVYAIPSTTEIAKEVGQMLGKISEAGKIDGVVNMWMYPRAIVNTGTQHATTTYAPVYYEVTGTKEMFADYARNSVLHSNYTPRNNKLLTYPYNYLYITDNNGGSAVYKYEYFSDPTYCNFKLVGSPSPDGTVKMYPLNYCGQQHAYEYGVSLGNFPTCAWESDQYKLWLAQNQGKNTLSYITGGAQIAAGAVAIATGAGAGVGVGLIASGAAGVANTLTARHDAKVQPDQARGSQSPAVNMGAGFQTFTVSNKCIDVRTARILDKYFDMYGYKTNSVKVPNIMVRENWTYTKTIGCKIDGDIAMNDQLKIESIYDQGITFWRHGDFIGNYARNNGTLGGD